jgi:hypothetical protein
VNLNRHHYYFAGLLLLLVGLQFRLVESYELNERVTNALADKFGENPVAQDNPLRQLFPAAGPLPRKTLRPPSWTGWCILSVGAVLVLHSLAMPKPGG